MMRISIYLKMFDAYICLDLKTILNSFFFLPLLSKLGTSSYFFVFVNLSICYYDVKDQINFLARTDTKFNIY
jgi:hypothetical protein